MENDFGARQYTRKELLINWRNQLADALMKSEINLKFHIMSTKLLKKKDPEYAVATTQVTRTERVVSENRKKIDLVDEELKKEK